MSDELVRFYDTLSEDYHLLHRDWCESVRSQGATLDRLLADELGPGRRRVLDCACGIGTQAIGLALRGHRVTGTDLSPVALARARREAGRLGVPLETAVADLRRLEGSVEGGFGAVLACDNALAHLEPGELAPAFRSMAAVLRPAGLLLVSLRDYDRLAEERPELTSAVLRREAEGRRIAFQVWDWDVDGSGYVLDQFVVAEREGGFETACSTARLHAHRKAAVLAALGTAGLARARWLPPEESGYYQPIAVGRKSPDAVPGGRPAPVDR